MGDLLFDRTPTEASQVGEAIVIKGWIFIGVLAIVFVLTTLWAISVQPVHEDARQAVQREEVHVDWRERYKQLRTFPATVWDAMQNADVYVAMSIDPSSVAGASQTSTAIDSLSAAATLHGYAVPGSIVVSDPKTRAALSDSIRRGIEAWDGAASACAFQPRHAVRVVRGNRVIDIVICYRCGDVYIHDSSAQKEDGRYILRELLEAANIPVAAE